MLRHHKVQDLVNPERRNTMLPDLQELQPAAFFQRKLFVSGKEERENKDYRSRKTFSSTEDFWVITLCILLLTKTNFVAVPDPSVGRVPSSHDKKDP